MELLLNEEKLIIGVKYTDDEIKEFQQNGITVFTFYGESGPIPSTRHEIHQIDSFSLLSPWFFWVDIPIGNFQTKPVRYKVLYVTRPLNALKNLTGGTPTPPIPYDIKHKQLVSDVYVMGMLDYSTHGADSDIDKLPKTTPWYNLTSLKIEES